MHLHLDCSVGLTLRSRVGPALSLSYNTPCTTCLPAWWLFPKDWILDFRLWIPELSVYIIINSTETRNWGDSSKAFPPSQDSARIDWNPEPEVTQYILWVCLCICICLLVCLCIWFCLCFHLVFGWIRCHKDYGSLGRNCPHTIPYLNLRSPLQWALKDLKIRDIYGSTISVLFCYCVHPRTKKKYFNNLQTKRLVGNNFLLFESSNAEEIINNPNK